MAAPSDPRKSGHKTSSLRAAEEVLPQFMLRLQLGAGSFGRVFLMEHKETGFRIAVKTLKKERIFQLGMIEKVKREINILLKLRHPNVIRLYDVKETSKYVITVGEIESRSQMNLRETTTVLTFFLYQIHFVGDGIR